MQAVNKPTEADEKTPNEFDVYNSFNKLLEAGLTKKQVRALSEMIQDKLEFAFASFATKDQVTSLEEKISLPDIRFEENNRVLEQKFITTDTKIENIQKVTENQIATIKEQIAKFMAETKEYISKNDAAQKAWLLGILLSIIGITFGIFMK